MKGNWGGCLIKIFYEIIENNHLKIKIFYILVVITLFLNSTSCKISTYYGSTDVVGEYEYSRANKRLCSG